MVRRRSLATAVALIALCVSLAAPATASTQRIARLRRLTIVPSTIKVGAYGTATITLKRVAKTDVVVRVASSDEWVALPFQDTVTIPAGQRSTIDNIYGLHT